MNLYAIETTIDPDDEDLDSEFWVVVACHERRAHQLVTCRSAEAGKDVSILETTFLCSGVLSHPEAARRCGIGPWT